MQYLILHESRQRMRLRVPRLNLTLREADILEAYLNSLSFVKSARVHERTGDAIVFFVNKGAGRPALLKALDRFSFVDEHRCPRSGAFCPGDEPQISREDDGADSGEGIPESVLSKVSADRMDGREERPLSRYGAEIPVAGEAGGFGAGRCGDCGFHAPG